MKLIERLGHWYDLFDKQEFDYILEKLRTLYYEQTVLPDSHNIFKAFEECPLDKCNVIMLFQDPYPQRNVATGIAVANFADKPLASLSPSLRKLKEAVPDVDDDFDNTLIGWSKQGVLLLNSALTVVHNIPNSHSLMWRPFISAFLKNYSIYRKDSVYVLFGKQAQSFRPCIKNSVFTLEVGHPAYYARTNQDMPTVLTLVNEVLVNTHKTPINWNVRKQES